MIRPLLPLALMALASMSRAQTPSTTTAPEGLEAELGGVKTVVDPLDPERPLDVEDRARIFKQAEQRKAELKRLEALIERRAARLKRTEQDLEARYKSLRLIQDELVALSAKGEEAPAGEGAVDKAKEALERAQRVKKLSKVFDKMKPDEAAGVVSAMDEGLSVAVLAKVKPRQAAGILGALPPKLAARLSSEMAALKKRKEGE
ncbi:hypothetical protein KKF91_03790 [Myxococcota bacterium]|nr:hypothetical protein [Myxococcota bacterium]MBU1429665.1 hypothetical protein [Myxococcota bacterium]MBU1898126.1 hypothetical protein [Myxococcota bacterium]